MANERTRQAVATAVRLYETPRPAADVSPDELLATLAAAQELTAAGAAATFATAALRARAGRLADGIDGCARAVAQEPAPRYLYGWIHLMQLAGRWEESGAALDTVPRDSQALACLRLCQLRRDGDPLAPETVRELLGGRGPAPLVEARLALLRREPCDLPPLREEPTREAAEEELRLRLALAGRESDAGELRRRMAADPLFPLFPAPERAFYEGLAAWLEGDAERAGELLEEAVRGAPGLLPALRCLAALRAQQGEPLAAFALWGRVLAQAPGDGQAVVRRALASAAAGRRAEGIASLRSFRARQRDEPSLAFLQARLQLATALGRAARVGQEDWQSVARPAGNAAETFESLAEIPEAPAYAWVCRTLCKMPRTPAQRSDWLLLAGAVALSLQEFATFEQLAEAVGSQAPWDVLRAVALARQGDQEAVAAFCALLRRGAAQWPSRLSLAGALAFLGARGPKRCRPEVAATLAVLSAELLAGDEEAAVGFLHANVLVGQGRAAATLLARDPRLLSEAVRREIRRLLCHEAALALEARDPAGAWATLHAGDPAPELQELSPWLRPLAATQNLLRALSPHENLGADPRRFHCLSELLAGGDPAAGAPPPGEDGRDRLRHRLVEQALELRPEVWQVRFRGLAILHWEWGLEARRPDPPLVEEAVECFRFASFLWRHLLTDERFWPHFCAEAEVTAAEAEAVRDRIEEELFACHREQARLHLVSSDTEGCRLHLSCLEDWDRPPRLQYLTPDYAAAHKSEGFCEARARVLATHAAQAFEGWVSDVLWRARQRRDDPQARDRLPPGVRCDYDAALAVVSEALEVVPDEPRLRMFFVEQCADLAFELVAAERRAEAGARLEPAIALARAAANERFRPGALNGPDGQLLRRTFDYAWKLEENPQRRLRRLREYLHWNGPDAKAEAALHRATARGAWDSED